MCCFGSRVTVLVSITILSFLLHYAFPNFAVVQWYILNINIFSFFLLFVDYFLHKKDKKTLPNFSFYYFSFIGGVFGIIFCMLILRHKFEKKFILIQILILIFWLLLIFLILTNFDFIQNTTKGLLNE